MKALLYTAPRRLEMLELADPVPKNGEVLVRVRVAGVCGSDLHGFLGRSKTRVPPLILGHEFTGEVAASKDGDPGIAPGGAVAVYPILSCGTCEYCPSEQEHLCPARRVYGSRHEGYAVSQRKRKRVEEVFGWVKTIALQRKTRFRDRIESDGCSPSQQRLTTWYECEICWPALPEGPAGTPPDGRNSGRRRNARPSHSGCGNLALPHPNYLFRTFNGRFPAAY